MNRRTLALTLVILSSMAGFGQTVRSAMHMVPTGKGWAIEAAPDSNTAQSTQSSSAIWQQVARNSQSNGVIYHGGPVMPGTVHIYFIWYGNWSGGRARSDSQTTVTLLETLFSKTGVGASSYAKTLSTYSDTRSTVTGSYYLADSTTDNYSKGKTLSDDAVKTIVTNAIQSGRLPKDSNGMYFVLTSSDVSETSGFCSKYCGWHYHGTILRSDIKYGFVGNSDRCASSCAAQLQSPNGNSGGDGMASVLAHETAEALTDPDLNGWYDSNGQEVGDKCAWHWGPVKGTLGYGAYNQTFGGHHFLLQMLWENSRGGGCVQSKGGTFYNR